MQIIKTILKLSGGNANPSDEYGKKISPPEVKIGIAAIIEADLRCDLSDPVTGQLLPYPFDELSGADSFYFCLDGDWDHATQPKLLRTSGIFVSQSEDGRTILRAELPQTALPELLAAVEKKQSVTLTAEFCGYQAENGTASATFAWSFSLVLRNRVFLGNPPAEVVNNPAYLTASEVMALIAEATRPVQNPGPQGDSAYAVAVTNGYEGTETEWLTSLKVKGEPGFTAYELAAANGYEGTITQWLTDLEGASAYEVAVAEGYTGTKAEWLASLKGADGKGLEFDATGTLMEKSLYDDRPAGFKFAATVVDSVARKTTLYVYAKNSGEYADWCANPVVVVFFAAAPSSIAAIAPVEFKAPTGGDRNYLFFSLASYPHAHISHVVIDTDDGELVLPYWSDLGVRKILKKSGLVYIYFGANVPAYATGRVYLSQMVAANTIGEIITTGNMYYGYVLDNDIASVTEVTPETLTQSTMTAVEAAPLDKQSIGIVPAGAWIIVIVPVGYTATKFDGISAQVPFSENNGESGTGANGVSIELDGKTYKLYGEFQLTNAEKFIYVD